MTTLIVSAFQERKLVGMPRSYIEHQCCHGSWKVLPEHRFEVSALAMLGWHTHTNTKKNCSEESDIPLASACFDHSKMPPEVKYPVLKWSRGNCKGSARWLLRFRLLVEDLPQVQHWYFLTFPIYQFIHFIHIIQFSNWGRASFATSCWAPQSQARFGTRCSSGQLEREMHKIPAWYGWYVFNTYCVRIREWWDAHQFLTAKMEQG